MNRLLDPLFDILTNLWNWIVTSVVGLIEAPLVFVLGMLPDALTTIPWTEIGYYWSFADAWFPLQEFVTIIGAWIVWVFFVWIVKAILAVIP